MPAVRRAQSDVFSNGKLAVATVAGIFSSRKVADRVFGSLNGREATECYLRKIRHNMLAHVKASSVGLASVRPLNILNVAVKSVAYQTATPATVGFPVVVVVDIAMLQVDRTIWLLAVWGVGPAEVLLEVAAKALVERTRK